MAVERQFIVKLLADPSGLIDDFKTIRGETEKTFGVANEKLLRLMPTFKVLTTAAAGVFGGLVAGAGLAVKAAAEAEAEQHRLRQILLTTGKASAEQVDALNKQADALERVGVVSGGNITVLQSQLATFDLQADTIQRLTPAIVDYVVAEKGAAATAEDFKQMTNGLAQALNGQFGALTRVGFTLDDNTKEMIKNGTEAERSAALVEVLNSTYGGFNESLRGTTEGGMQAFRNSLNKLSEDLGKALLPVLNVAVSVLAKLAQVAADNSTAVGVLAVAVGTLSGGILLLAGYLKVAAFQKRLMNDEFLRGMLTMKTAEGQTTTLGKAVQGLGKGFAVIAAAQGVFMVLNEVGDTARKVEDQIKRTTVAVKLFGDAGTGSAKNVVVEFSKAARTIQDQFRLGDIIKEFGRDFQFTIDGVKVNIEAADEAFRKFLDSDPAKAQQIIDALKEQLAVTDPSSRSYRDLKDAIDRYQGSVNLAFAAQKTYNKELNITEANLKATRDAFFKNQLELGKITDVTTRAKDNQKQFDAVAKDVAKTLKSQSSATNTLTKAKENLKTAVKGVESAQISERNSKEKVTEATKALERADDTVTKAKEKLAAAIRGVGKESKEGVAAARQLRDAQRGLAKAQQGVLDAQNRVIAAEKALAELRNKKANPDEITNAEFGLEKSKLDVEEATLRVDEAEKELADTLADPNASPLEKRKAELGLKDAKLALRDAIMEQGNSERELIAIRATGATAEELAEAERELKDAKDAVQEAIDNQAEALERLNEEQEAYRKLVEGIREGDKEFIELSAEVVKAEEAQTDAARDLRDAREAAAKATDELRKAEEELRASRKEERTATGSAPGRAFGGPVAAGRAYTVGEMGPELFVPTSSGTIIPNNRMGGGTTVNVVVNAGLGTSGIQVAQQIVDVLSQYTKVSGPLSQYVSV